MSFQGDILDTSQLHLTGDFEAQVKQLLTIVRLTRQEVEALKNLLADLSAVLNRRWPGCVVHPFGSVVMGLGIRTSDIDCYVSLPEWVTMDSQDKQIVFKAKHYLQIERDLFSELTAIPMAKVPIVKFYHIPTERYCDVNFKSPSGVRNSNLLATLLHIDPRVLPLSVLIKYWSKVHGLTGTNLLPNYSLTLLVIFYLQQVGVVPTVQYLQESIPPLFVEHWNTAFRETDFYFDTNKSLSLYELLGGFFDFYSTFDYETQVISPYMGSPVKKECFKKFNEVPKEFGLYKDHVRDKVCRPLRVDTSMCVQDPFEHCRNCTVAVHQRLFSKIIAFFKNSAKLFFEVHSRVFLKSILTKFQYTDNYVPQNRNQLPNKIQKRKQGNNVKHNIKKNIHFLYNEFRQRQGKR